MQRRRNLRIWLVGLAVTGALWGSIAQADDTVNYGGQTYSTKLQQTETDAANSASAEDSSRVHGSTIQYNANMTVWKINIPANMSN